MAVPAAAMCVSFRYCRIKDLVYYLNREMKSFIVFITAVVFCTCSVVAQEPEGRIIPGPYMTHNRISVVEIYLDGDAYFGRLSTHDGKDASCLEICILRSVVSRNGKLRGKLYDPTENKEYNVVVSPGDNGTLDVIASLGPFHRKMVWTRVMDPSLSALAER